MVGVRARRAAAVATATALLLTACTGADETPEEAPDAGAPATSGPSGGTTSAAPSGTDPSTSATPTPTPSATIPAAARPPRDGACYALDFRAATAPTNDDDPVPCREEHTTQTVYVARLETVVDGHLLAVDSERAQEQIRTACPREMRRHVGGTPRDHRLSRLEAIWFSPTIEQSDQGATWFRCDVVALGRGQQFASLPAPGRLEGILDRDDGLDEVGLCGTAAPGSRRFERVICSEAHSWKALDTLDLAGGRSYPGRAAVRRGGEDRCRELVRRASGDPDRFRYGWEWPTAQQWREGQRYGYCWAPD